MKALSEAQVKALLSANEETGAIEQTGPQVTTMKILEREGLITLDSWSTSGNVFGDRGRAWSARLTDLGWQWRTVYWARARYAADLEPEDVVMVNGLPTVDDVSPQEWLESLMSLDGES